MVWFGLAILSNIDMNYLNYLIIFFKVLSVSSIGTIVFILYVKVFTHKGGNTSVHVTTKANAVFPRVCWTVR